MTVPALDTTFLGTFAYIQPATSIQLADALAYFHSYQQFAEYVDGVMRIYDTGSQSGAPNNYCDVYVRIRTDGWMMAFIPDDAHQGTACWGSYGWTLGNYNNRGDLPWWGHHSNTTGNPTTNATRLGRALSELWTLLKTNSDNPTYTFDYADVGYYDYEHTTATKIYIFGRSVNIGGGDSVYYYFTIPVGTTLISCHVSEGHGYDIPLTSYAYINEGTGNAHTIWSGGISNEYFVDDLESYTFTGGVQNTIRLYNSSAWSGRHAYMNSAMVIFADG